MSPGIEAEGLDPFAPIRWAFSVKAKLSAAERLVLVYLAKCANPDGSRVWPGQRMTADECGLAYSTTAAAFSRLTLLGLIELVQPAIYGKGLKSRAAQYRLTMAEHIPGAPLPIAGSPPTEDRDPSPYRGSGPLPLPDFGATPTEDRCTPTKIPTKIKKERITPIIPTIDIPTWLPLEAWNGFVEHRKSLKGAKFTPRAISLTISTLNKLRQAGNDPGEVLDQSVQNGWRGIFPVKHGGSPQPREGALDWMARKYNLGPFASVTEDAD